MENFYAAISLKTKSYGRNRNQEISRKKEKVQ